MDGVHKCKHEKNSDDPAKRSNYRHGDLRWALLEVEIELARGGGPEAVMSREATQRAGVVPNAAYRHFPDIEALLEAVCEKSQSELSMAIENGIAALPLSNGPTTYAKAITSLDKDAWSGTNGNEPACACFQFQAAHEHFGSRVVDETC